MGRNPSSINREINRNSHPRLGYQPYGAQRKATAAWARPKTGKPAEPSELRSFVQRKLIKRWSPEQICASLVVQFSEGPRMRNNHKTIYQALYLRASGGAKREVQEALRTGTACHQGRKGHE